jgi:ATP-dependent Lon protease
MSENLHGMTTRSKIIKEPVTSESDISLDDEVDEEGNLKGLIDYACNEDFDQKELDQQLNRLRGFTDKPKKKKKKITKKRKSKLTNDNKLNDVFMTYLILKATEKANDELKNKNKKEKSKIKVTELDKEEINLDSPMNIDSPTTDKSDLINLMTKDLPSSDSEDGSYTSCDKESSDIELESNSEKDTDSEVITSDESEISITLESDTSDTKSESSEDYSYEYDDLDDKYEELIDKQMMLNSEESNMEFYHHLPKEKKEFLLNATKEIYEVNGSNTPLRFKVIESQMNMKTKAIALENIDKLSEMDVSTGEHSKMDHWINGLMRIPFGTYNTIPVNTDSSTEEKRKYIKDTYQTLDHAIYGHKDAKTHILQVIGKWIKNPTSGGNVLAIQGPMGNGKTTLVKDGISKVLNRPFAFIALGGASDSAYFDGHCFTYEGSHWGRIVQILQDSKCMNPIIYFDELDKVSDTPKGDEIIHMLTHLTDPSQNNLFQDNYFPGINLDLSKALFIFSYNDETMVNKILKDRMYVIHTKGFGAEDKLKICREYLIPEIYDIFAFSKEDIIFTDEIIKNIITDHTDNEEGVRNLKRCIETIISKINIHIISDGDSDLSFTLKDFKLPVTLTKEHIEILLKGQSNSDKIPFGMYC